MATRLATLALFTLRTQKPAIQIRGWKRWVAPTLKELKCRKERMEPEPLQRRSTFSDWNYKAELFAFGKRLGEDFDSAVLRRALTTREYIVYEIEQQKSVGIEDPELDLSDNRKMVESGEKMINSYTLRYLRTVLPKFPEEGIIALQNHLCNDDTLSKLSSNIGLGDIILTSEYPVEKITLANGFKAIVAALAECSGLDRANTFIRDFVITQIVGININDIWQIENPLSILSNILEVEGKSPFDPRLVAESGRNTILANYQVGLYVDKELIGLGFGESIKIAKEMAARDALSHLFETTDTMKPLNFNLKLKCDSSEPFANLSVKDWCEKNVSQLLKQ